MKLSTILLAMLPFCTGALAQVDSVSAGRMLGNRGVTLPEGSTGSSSPVPPATGIGGVPAGYEEISVPLPGPGASISATTADVLRSIGYPFIDASNSGGFFGGAGPGGVCGGDYSGNVRYVVSCPRGFSEDGNVCTPSTAYTWCGATGTATLMRKIQTDGRIPTQLDITAITSISTANGTVGVLDDATTLKKVCAMNGFVSVWSYLGYEYDPGGTFRRCGTRPTSYWTGTAWGMTNSCKAVGQLTCY